MKEHEIESLAVSQHLNKFLLGLLIDVIYSHEGLPFRYLSIGELIIKNPPGFIHRRIFFSSFDKIQYYVRNPMRPRHRGCFMACT